MEFWQIVPTCGYTRDSLQITHLFATNKVVDLHNKVVFWRCCNSKCDVKAIDLVIDDISDEVKRPTIQRIPDEASKTIGLSTKVKLAVSLKYDISTNVAVLDGHQ